MNKLKDAWDKASDAKKMTAIAGASVVAGTALVAAWEAVMPGATPDSIQAGALGAAIGLTGAMSVLVPLGLSTLNR